MSLGGSAHAYSTFYSVFFCRETLVMLSEAMRGAAEGTPFSEEVMPLTKPCADEPLLHSIYLLKTNFSKVGHMLPPEFAVGRHRSDA